MKHRDDATGRRHRRPLPAAAVLAVLAALVVAGLGVVLLMGGEGASRSPAGKGGTADPFPIANRTVPPAPLPATPGPVAASTTSPPVHLDVPAIGVSTDLEGLAILPDGSLEPPTAWQVAGWFDAGVRPGDVGPAVIAGHVDSTAGPAVFVRLRDLAVGDLARITRADGTTVTFVVDTVARFPKSQFPTDTVYGRVSLPVLRLITCTGDFDRGAHSYVDNLVVSLHLVTAAG